MPKGLATASSTNALPAPDPFPPPPEPWPPTPTPSDDDEFDMTVDPELFSYLLLTTLPYHRGHTHTYTQKRRAEDDAIS